MAARSPAEDRVQALNTQVRAQPVKSLTLSPSYVACSIRQLTLASRPPKSDQQDFRQILTGVRTISTEHLAWRATNSATLPSKKRWMPLRPCEPRTIRSAPHSAA